MKTSFEDKKDQFRINKLEEQMRENAIAISQLFEKIKAIDKNAGYNSFLGIIEYLKERYES